jgi:hypothetical protein
MELNDHENSAQSLTACVKEKKEKISSLSEKLERLLNGYLDQVTEQQDYRIQKVKLLSEKKSLEMGLQNQAKRNGRRFAPPMPPLFPNR